MNKIISLLIFFLFVNCKQPADKIFRNNKIVESQGIDNQKKVVDTIHGDFNKDSITDYIEIKNHTSNKQISIFLGNDDGKFNLAKYFSISNDDFSEVENPIENFFISNVKSGEIIYGASCCANFKTTEEYHYKFLKNNWYLFKTIISTIDEDFVPNISIEMTKLSPSIDGEIANNISEYNKEISEIKKNTMVRFLIVYQNLKIAHKNKSIKNLNSLGFDELAEITYFNPLTEANVNAYNDIAFFNSFTKNGNISTIFLLKKIINQFPDRVVTYLNLADAYWGLDNKTKAKKSYKKYFELMNAQKKDLSKIPKRVYERIK